ncbi:hypothetical protein ACJ6YJ_32830, partial [Pseudomonas marginalis]|uniref:hypothetical protein n=1 Tax=Pseudomonas TaxID=286 RepID=UPI003899A1E3
LFDAINDSIFSVESGEKEVLTAACNAVEFASPLTRDRKRKWLKLLKKSSKASENNHLTANEAAVECAPRLRRK